VQLTGSSVCYTQTNRKHSDDVNLNTDDRDSVQQSIKAAWTVRADSVLGGIWVFIYYEFIQSKRENYYCLHSDSVIE